MRLNGPKAAWFFTDDAGLGQTGIPLRASSAQRHLLAKRH
jgi:hypothetical protein